MVNFILGILGAIAIIYFIFAFFVIDNKKFHH